jgi:hypothetical protein
MSYIGKLFNNSNEDSLFMRGILRAGMDGGCSCPNGWKMYDNFLFHRPCIFEAHLIAESHYWGTYRRVKSDFPEFQCACPIINNN